MTDKVISRGYVKWEDSDGFHKEPLYKHEDLLASATPQQQLRAEEVRRLNEAAEVEESKSSEEEDVEDTLEALQEAPDDVLTAAALVAELDNASAPGESAELWSEDHDAALRQLREETTG
jgi:hypothetical protein